MMKKFDFLQMLESVQKFKISNLIMVPPIVVVSSLFSWLHDSSMILHIRSSLFGLSS